MSSVEIVISYKGLRHKVKERVINLLTVGRMKNTLYTTLNEKDKVNAKSEEIYQNIT